MHMDRVTEGGKQEKRPMHWALYMAVPAERRGRRGGQRKLDGMTCGAGAGLLPSRCYCNV